MVWAVPLMDCSEGIISMFHREQPATSPDAGVPSADEQNREGFPVYGNKVMEQTAVARHAGAAEQRGSVANQNASGPVVFNQQAQPAEKKDTKDMNASENQADKQNADNAQQPNRMDIPGGAFQRPGQPAVGRVPGAYPGAYPGSTPVGAPAYGSAATTSPAANEAGRGRKLVIGQGITLSGEIEACEHLMVEGTVEAALKGASVLEIAETGAFYGTVEIDEATVAGRFEGDLTVKGRLTIRSGGSITGAIAYKELAVEAGATLDGKVTPLDAKSSQNAGGRKVTDNNRSKKPDNNTELPFADKAAAAAE
jgi:cytoskeletal protein CcmA (bactofilin family)